MERLNSIVEHGLVLVVEQLVELLAFTHAGMGGAWT